MGDPNYVEWKRRFDVFLNPKTRNTWNEITNHKKCFDMIVEWLIGTWFGLSQKTISVGSNSFSIFFCLVSSIVLEKAFSSSSLEKNRIMTIVNVVIRQMWIESELENWDGWNDCLEWTHSEGVYWFLEWMCLFWNSLIQYNTNPIHNCIYEDAKSETNRQYSDDMENTTQHEKSK